MRKFKLKTAFIKLWGSFIVCGLRADLWLLCGRLCNNADTYFFMYGLMAVKPWFKDTSLLWTVFLVLKERMPWHFSKFNPFNTNTSLIWTLCMAPSMFVLTGFDYSLLFLITLKVSKEKWIFINEDGLICSANYIDPIASCSCYSFLQLMVLFFLFLVFLLFVF